LDEAAGVCSVQAVRSLFWFWRQPGLWPDRRYSRTGRRQRRGGYFQGAILSARCRSGSGAFWRSGF